MKYIYTLQNSQYLTINVYDSEYNLVLILTAGQPFLKQQGHLVPSVTAGCVGSEVSACTKDLGDKTVLRKMARGHLFVVRGGGHIDTWSPLYQ